MKILLSPAKSLNKVLPEISFNYTQPQLINEASILASKLKTHSVADLKLLMKLSLSLAELNFERFQEWNLPFNIDNSCPCGWMFSGEAYRGLDYASLTKNDIEFSQKSLRILSGFYGVLRPLDLIQTYRLEMGTRLIMSDEIKNLYSFWGDKITRVINKNLVDDEVVVNLASNEYFKSINVKKLKGNLIQCIFKEDREGELKMITSYVKRARGLMSRYIIKNRIENSEDLIGFIDEGYAFSPKLSSKSEFIFIR